MSTNIGQEAERASVIEAIETFTSYLVQGDFTSWLAYWANDGVLMPPGQTNVVGREAISRYVRANFGEVESMTLSDWDVDVEGDLAIAASKATWRGPSGDRGSLKQVLVLRRAAGGRWIRRRVIYNELSQTRQIVE